MPIFEREKFQRELRGGTCALAQTMPQSRIGTGIIGCDAVWMGWEREHVFARPGARWDGTGANRCTCPRRTQKTASASQIFRRELQRMLQGAGLGWRAATAQRTSSDCRRVITALVNSLVEAWPPRSGVLTPSPTTARVASWIASPARAA